MVHDEIDTTFADMCFRNTMITQSVYSTDHMNIIKKNFKSISDHRNVVSLILLTKKDGGLLNGSDFQIIDVKHLHEQFEN